MLLVALAVVVPTVGDFGLTWDEPAYRYSQILSAQWWEQLGKVRSWHDVQEVFDPLTLLYFWPYGRHGINFHPPLAGPVEPGGSCAFRSLDERHPVAADGIGHRVCPHDHDRLSLPGAALRSAGWGWSWPARCF